MHHQVIVVGAGMGGVATGIALDRAGIHDFVLLERAGDVGGTWRDNSYPGCQCDIASHLYSFSFAPNPDWSRTYPLQAELRAYVRATVEQAGLRPRIRFDTPVTAAGWDEGAQVWRVTTPGGELTAGAMVLASGPLSQPKVPSLPGLDRFGGTVFHSSQWNHDHDLTGRRVAVVGTGASTVQFLPHVQRAAERVVLFQRTAPWVIPHPDRAIHDWERALFRRFPATQRFLREWCYWYRELEIPAFALQPKLLRGVGAMARLHLRRQVADPALRAKLTPHYQAGCKRLLLSNHYYPALTQPNVEVVAGAVTAVGEHSVTADDGSEHEVDTLILGTGFSVTDNPMFDVVRGRGGTSLAEAWRATGLRAYKGITVPGFPNLFLLAGPNTSVGNTSLLVMIEAQVGYVADALAQLVPAGQVVEPRASTAARWTNSVQQRLGRTVWQTGGCSSYYQDDHGRNTVMWPDFTFRYRSAVKRFDGDAYVTTRRPTAEPLEPSGV